MNKRTKRLLAMMSAKPKLRTVSGLPPLSYKAKKAGTLSNYRIYGNTVSGESVGDRTGNLFDERYVGLSAKTYYFHINVGDGTFTLSTNAPKNSADTTNIYLIAGAVSTGASYVNNGVSFNAPRTVTSSNGYVTVAYRISGGINPSDYHAMLNTGSEPLPYEPYGYRVPVTVTNGTDTQTTNIYLPEPLTKSGDNADYTDFVTKKQHYIDGTSADVTLPALPTLPGTNTLSVGTTVQPSAMEVTGRIKSAE